MSLSFTNIFKKQSVEGIDELVLYRNAFQNFKFVRDATFYRVNESDLQRPDLISYKNYGVQDYWFVILWYNDIEDPFNDLETGDLLEMPSEIDIEDFFSFARTYKKN